MGLFGRGRQAACLSAGFPAESATPRKTENIDSALHLLPSAILPPLPSVPLPPLSSPSFPSLPSPSSLRLFLSEGREARRKIDGLSSFPRNFSLPQPVLIST